MKKRGGATKEGGSASQLISNRIAELGDWRGEMLGKIRALIKQVDPGVIEEWKWMGTPIWSHDGIICTGETYKSVVKMTFAKGAFLDDPSRLFNSSLEGNLRRAIDVHEGEKLKVAALKALIREAIALNVSKKSAPTKKKVAAAKKSAAKKGAANRTPSAKKTPTKKTPTAKKTSLSVKRRKTH